MPDLLNRLPDETHLTNEDGVINKVVYKYDAKEKQTGFSLFEAGGKLISGSASPGPIASASKPRGALAR